MHKEVSAATNLELRGMQANVCITYIIKHILNHLNHLDLHNAV